MSLWLVYVFICSAYGVSFNCDDELECTHDIMSTISDRVSGRGYKSLFQSPSAMADTRFCSGALSCQQTPHIIFKTQLACDGALSCTDTIYINSSEATSNIWSIGANALTNTTLSCAATCDCTGSKSCANSTIFVFESCTLGGHGALSLFGANIYVIGGTLTAQMYAFYAGYQASIYCQNGSICNIECSDNGCDGLSVLCDITSQCSISPTEDSVFVALSNTNIILDTNEASVWNSTTITKLNEEQCSIQSTDRTFDNYQEHSGKIELIYTTDVGPICCRAMDGCSYSSITYNSTSSAVVCSGENSCYQTPITSSNDLMVECSGRSSCWQASIIANGGNIYCASAWSCNEATITKMSHIYCNGYMSCTYANIESSGTNISVYFTGYQAAHHASVICNETDHCTILCSGFQACGVGDLYKVSLTCHGTCSVECYKNAHCPDGYTVNPTPNPTTSPTLPTASPSPSPSKAPTTGAPTADTSYPTVMPSIVPSQSPTLPPTTHFPTLPPTMNPTIEPTINPSVEPTLLPTVNPSKTPSGSPTSHPTMFPTLSPSRPPTSPTSAPIDFDAIAKSQEESLQNIAKTFEYANIAIVSPFLFVAITGFIDAKFLRINDVFSIGKMMQPLLQTLDAMSDIFLCLEVSLIYNYDYALQNESVYLVLLICMAIFILIPILLSLVQLATISNKYWINDKSESAFYVVNSAAIRVWFAKYMYILYIASVVTGSSFGATALFNSNLYGLSIFDMGLSESTLAHFKTKRIYSVILCENIPQLIFQIIYWRVTSTKSIIVVVSMVYSAISILVTLITIYTQRRIIYMQQAVFIQFDVTGAAISYKNSAKLRNRFHGIQRELSKLFGIDKAVIEVIRPIVISNGIRIILLIKVDGDINEHLVRFKTAVHDANNSLLNAVKKGWDLDDVNDDGSIQITNIELSAKQSKQSMQEARHIQLSKTTNNQEIESLANDDET